MTSLLNLKRARVCKLGSHINVRAETHGDETVPAADVQVCDVLLDESELDTLLGAGAHKALYVKNGGGAPLEPRFRDFKPFALLHKFSDSRVALEIDGVKDDVVFDDVKLARLRIAPQIGGLTAVSVSVQCNPSSEVMGLLYDHLESEVKAKIRFGTRVERSDNQDELPLDGGGNGADDEAAAE